MTAARALVLRAGARSLSLVPGAPAVMGIANASPDSFADRVPARGAEHAIERGRRALRAGAAIVDVGGQSGVTHTPEISPQDECARVVEVVAELAAAGGVVSIDTYRAQVAAAAVDAGAAIVNDVSGLADPELADVCASTGAALVIMHTRAAPKRERFPRYDDVVADVHAFLADRMELAGARGVAAEQILLDPGPDFAKTPEQSVAVLRELRALAPLGRPLLAAVGRKYFLGAITGRGPLERLPATLAAVGAAADAGASVVRVHDVAEVVDYLAVRAVMRGERQFPAYDPGDERLKWVRPSRCQV